MGLLVLVIFLELFYYKGYGFHFTLIVKEARWFD